MVLWVGANLALCREFCVWDMTKLCMLTSLHVWRMQTAGLCKVVKRVGNDRMTTSCSEEDLVSHVCVLTCTWDWFICPETCEGVDAHLEESLLQLSASWQFERAQTSIYTWLTLVGVVFMRQPAVARAF